MQEKELINECKSYNPIAQRIIYKKYYPVFFNICTRFILNHDDAKDILQEAFLKIFTHVNKYRNEGSFEAWMKRIVINETLTYLRRKNKESIKAFSDFSESDLNEINIIDDTQEDENNPYSFTENELLNAIKSIPENLRTVFNLACIDGYSHKEIASVLSISEENSRIRLMHARLKLKKILYPKAIIKGNSI